MTSISLVLRENVESTNNIVARSNAFHTWDESMDKDTIEQGILDRLAMFEQFEDINLGLRIVREEMDVTRIDIADMDSGKVLDDIKVFLLTKKMIGLNKYFNAKEEKMIVDFMSNHAH